MLTPYPRFAEILLFDRLSRCEDVRRIPVPLEIIVLFDRVLLSTRFEGVLDRYLSQTAASLLFVVTLLFEIMLLEVLPEKVVWKER
jgi:hypothetical protein